MSNHAGHAFQVHGTVAPGFESVKQLYAREMQTMAEKNTQLCVYYRGERVVDLWASVTHDAGFSADSIVNVFSSGKSLETIAIASLVGRGLVDYETKIAAFWPEFGAHGKDDITVADVMRHEAGLAALNVSLDPDDLLTENIKKNKVGSVIERHAARFRKDGGRREYHAITRGWIVNEIFRRLDPAGRTVGEYFREEVSGPLEADAFIGVQEADFGRISKVWPLGFLFLLLESLKPKVLGRKIKHNFLQILGRLLRIIPSIRHATVRGAPPPYKGMKKIDFFNERIVARGETPSAASNCSARGLAKIAAMMSAKGIWKDTTYLNDAGWKGLHANPVEADMGFAPTNFTQGGVNFFTPAGLNATSLDHAFNGGREGFYGWMGLGGSIFQWHPEHEIGFAFVPTCLHVIDILNERGKVYQAEVLRCVERLQR